MNKGFKIFMCSCFINILKAAGLNHPCIGYCKEPTLHERIYYYCYFYAVAAVVTRAVHEVLRL